MNAISRALNGLINELQVFIENMYFLGDLGSQGQGGTVLVLGSHSSFHEARKKENNLSSCGPDEK